MTWPGFFLPQVQVSVFRWWWAGRWAAVNSALRGEQSPNWCHSYNVLWVIHYTVNMAKQTKFCRKRTIEDQKGMQDLCMTVWQIHFGKRYELKGLFAMGMQETGMNQQALKITIHTPNRIPISHQCELDFMEQLGIVLLWKTTSVSKTTSAQWNRNNEDLTLRCDFIFVVEFLYIHGMAAFLLLTLFFVVSDTPDRLPVI